MKRRLAAAFLAMAFVFSGSTMAWAVEGEENAAADTLDNVSRGDDNVLPEPIVPVETTQKGTVPAAATESKKTQNGEGVTEEADTDENTINEGEKAVDSETVSGTLNSGGTWALKDGVLTISGDGAISWGYGEGWYNKDIMKIIVGEGVTEIGPYAFTGCSGMTEISLPEGITEIGEHAFFGCSGMTEISLPEGITEIGPYAFENCTSLTEISIPRQVKRISAYSFCSCEALTSVDIPDGVGAIEYGAFKNCKSLSEITIPKSVNELGHGVFAECKGIDKVTFEGDAPYFTYDPLVKEAPFHNVRASAYRPEGNKTWTNEIMRSMGTGLVWVSEKTTPLKIVPEATDFTYVIGSSGGVTIKCTGELKDFINVYMDGVEVDKSNYTLREGSTILTFATKYLDTLSVGKHTVTLNYTYGSIDTELTVLASGDGNSGTAGTTGAVGTSSTGNTIGASNLTKGSSPKTGDEASFLLWVLAAMCSLGIGAAVLRRKRSI